MSGHVTIDVAPGTYQSHDLPHSALHVEDFGALHPDQATLASQLWKENVGAIHLHDLADLIQAVEQNTINLMRRDHNILDVTFRVQDQLMELLFGLVDVVLAVSSDVYLVLSSPVRSRWGITINAGKRWREVNGGVGYRLDQPDILSSPTTDDGV